MEFYANNRSPMRSMTEAAQAFSTIIRPEQSQEIKPLSFNAPNLGEQEDSILPNHIKSFAEEFRNYINSLNQNKTDEEPVYTEDTAPEIPEEPQESSTSNIEYNTSNTTNVAEDIKSKALESKMPKTIGRKDDKNKAQTSKYAGHPDQFVKDYFKAGYNLGLNKNLIMNMFVKDVIESGWGAKNQSPYNFGNIKKTKNWKGSVVEGQDQNKTGNVIDASYRSYSSIEEYLRDEVSLLKRVYKIKDDDSMKTFSEKLTGTHKHQAKFKYAEDPNYFMKLLNTYMTCQNNGIFNLV